MTEQELQIIDELLTKLPGNHDDEWWIEHFKMPPSHYRDHRPEWDVRVGVALVASCHRQQDADYIAQSARIIRQLLAEVRYLQGQLSDLCEDSRAASEVLRLRGVLTDIKTRTAPFVYGLKSYQDYLSGMHSMHLLLLQIDKTVNDGLKGVSSR